MFLKSRSLKNAHAGADAFILRAFFPKVNHPKGLNSRGPTTVHYTVQWKPKMR
jgi:hypothetical protein